MRQRLAISNGPGAYDSERLQHAGSGSWKVNPFAKLLNMQIHQICGLRTTHYFNVLLNMIIILHINFMVITCYHKCVMH